MKYNANIIFMSITMTMIFCILIITYVNPVVDIEQISCYDNYYNVISNLTCEEKVYAFNNKLLYAFIPILLLIYFFNFLRWMEII